VEALHWALLRPFVMLVQTSSSTCLKGYHNCYIRAC
jgi:hypothetical protein